MASRTTWLCRLGIAVALLLPQQGSAQTGTRNFAMSAMGDAAGAVGDWAFFDMGNPQPAGRSILTFSGWDNTTWTVALASLSYDFSRIDAVLIDEPYWVRLYAGGWQNPCTPGDSRCPQVADVYSKLQAIGLGVKQTSARTRFWINFSEPEVQWIGAGSVNSSPPQQLFGAFVDVISMDKYGVDFNASVKPYYDFIVGHRSTEAQQIALVPGTFVLTAGPSGAVIAPYDGVSQASRLAGFFDYATQNNQSCNLPVGSLGLTTQFDGCMVFAIAGWPASGSGDSNNYFHGLVNDPQGTTAAILNTWNSKRSYAISRSAQAVGAVVTSVIYPMLNY